MFYDWNECVMSVLGATKHHQCIDIWQWSYIVLYYLRLCIVCLLWRWRAVWQNQKEFFLWKSFKAMSLLALHSYWKGVKGVCSLQTNHIFVFAKRMRFFRQVFIITSLQTLREVWSKALFLQLEKETVQLNTVSQKN